jgi:hypothetical protein
VGWEIVQNVINNKENFEQQYDRYSADVYIKGVETFEQKEKKVKEEDEEEKDEPSDIFEDEKKEIQDQINGDQNRLNVVEIYLTQHVELAQ